MNRPDYIRDAEARRGIDHAQLLEIADGVRLGNHQAASMLTTAQLDSMIDLIVSTGEDRSQLERQHSSYIATRYSLVRRSDGHATTTRQPSSAARAEKLERQKMIADSRNASRPSRPTRHTDHAPPTNAREREQIARRAMLRDAANAWRRK